MDFRSANLLHANSYHSNGAHLGRPLIGAWGGAIQESPEYKTTYARSIYKPNLNIRPSATLNSQSTVSSSLQDYTKALFLSKKLAANQQSQYFTGYSSTAGPKEGIQGTISSSIIKGMTGSTKTMNSDSNRNRANSFQAARRPTHTSHTNTGIIGGTYPLQESKDNYFKSSKPESNNDYGVSNSSRYSTKLRPSQSISSLQGRPVDTSARDRHNASSSRQPKAVNYQVTCSLDRSNGVVEAFGICTTQGIVKNFNEDAVSIIMNVVQDQKAVNISKEVANHNFSYFSVFDGHGGDACVNYLKEQLHFQILNDTQFPEKCGQAIFNGIQKAEKNFLEMAGANTNKVEKSGACCIVALFKGMMFMT